MTTDGTPNVTMSRRSVLCTAAGIALAVSPVSRVLAQEATPASDFVPELVIDLSGDLDSIDPAMAYAARDWSVVHSIYDSLVMIDAEGLIQPLAAATFDAVDDVTFETTLREGMLFHDGSEVNADAVIRGIDHLLQGDSLVIDLFQGITEVVRVDDLTVQITSESPSPWLPAQLAVWHVLLPENATSQSLSESPVGSGPYRFVSWEKGSEIVLERFPEYVPVEVKGTPIANRAVYRFVPDASTRVADLLSGSAHLVSEIPQDQLATIEEAGLETVSTGIVGSAWIRIATDVEPWSDPRVRQAANLALDVEGIAQVLFSPEAHRLASIHPDRRSMGFDPDLAPYAYDPDQARALLEEAGIGDGFDTRLEVTTSASQAVAEAIAAQWQEVGIRAEIVVSEYATFNGNWADPSAPPLKLSTWRPLYDPHTLLSLVWAGEGFLSRYDNPAANELINSAAVESDPETRAAIYRELADVMHDDAAAVFLWNLVANYGMREEAAEWQPRGDEYVLPLG